MLSKRVAERMSEIEQGAVALFRLVARDHGGFRGAGFCNGFEPRRAAGEDVAPARFQPFEEIVIVDQPVFDDLGVTRAEFALRQRVERRRIGEHQLRLVEGADEILAMRRIDAGLAADGGIDLRQQ